MSASGLEDLLPLSPMQEGMHFQSLYDESAVDVYNTQISLQLEGPLDRGRLRTAVLALLRRHANLRASFRQRKNGEPIQVIHREIELPWVEVDLSSGSGSSRADALDRLLSEHRTRRFDLTRAPLIRFALVVLGEHSHRLVMSNHHILLDGWSTPILVRELLALYGGNGDSLTLPHVTPYREYLSWLGRQDPSAARRAWL